MGRVLIPLIVIDTDLYECWLDGSGELQLSPREEMPVYVWRDLGKVDRRLVHIVTEKKLRSFANRVTRAHRVMFKPEVIGEAVDIFRLKQSVEAAKAQRATRLPRLKTK
jgi:hypothetical protein